MSRFFTCSERLDIKLNYRNIQQQQVLNLFVVFNVNLKLIPETQSKIKITNSERFIILINVINKNYKFNKFKSIYIIFET